MTALTASNTDETTEMPCYVNDNDLLGGELFGDELIDMYITPGDLMHDSSNEIPIPLPSDVMISNPEISKPCTTIQLNTNTVPQPHVSSPTTVVDSPAFAPSPSQIPSSDATSGQDNTRKRGIESVSPETVSAYEPATKTIKTSSSQVPTMLTNNSSKGPSPLTLKLLHQPSQPGNTPNPLLSRINKSNTSRQSLQTTSIPSPLTKPMVSNALADVQTAQRNLPQQQEQHKTEADFNAIAQAAVSNLIATGTSTSISPDNRIVDTASTDTGPPDISTAHIAALTSPTYLSTSTLVDDPSNPHSHSGVAPKRRCQNLTPDERVRQNRERNKRHARNTRLRKKAYIEELKRTLMELVAQRDNANLERRRSEQREVEEREVRFRVMEEFLRLRGVNERSVSRWVAILEEEFSLTVPNCEGFRSIVDTNDGGDNQNKCQYEIVLKGATSVMDDANMVNTFVKEAFGGDENQHIIYNCERSQFLMDNSNAVLEWNATDASGQFVLKGNMTAKFSPVSNKLESATILFDTGMVTSQIKGHIQTIGSTTNTGNHVKKEITPTPENTCSGSVVSKDDCPDPVDVYSSDFQDNLIDMNIDPTPVTSSGISY